MISMKVNKLSKIVVKDIAISLTSNDKGDYLSLTDMAKLKTYDNPNFNLMEYNKIKLETQR